MSAAPDVLLNRHLGLGASEAMAYCGKDPRCTPLELYLRKTGKAEPQRDDPRTDWGWRLEPVVRDWLAEELGTLIVPNPPRIVSSEYPFMFAHLDGEMPERGELAEIKTADKFEAAEFGEAESDEVPIRYVLQCTHQMIVSGYRRAHLGALVGGNDARRYVIDYDPGLAEILIDRARAFWRHVETRTPPPVQTIEDAAKRWPRNLLDKTVPASPEIVIALDEYKRMKAELKEREQQMETTELLLKTYMADASAITDARGKPLATWKEQGRKGIDMKALAEKKPKLSELIRARFETETRFRVLRVK